MSNPREKIFLLYHGMEAGPACTDFMKYVEEKMGEKYSHNPKKYMHWMRTRGGRMYIIGTTEDTLWTCDKITSKIQKNVPNVHSVFVVEIQDRPYQGLMDKDVWDFMNTVQDLTKHMTDNRRGKKLRKIKYLIDKKEELKRKAAELEAREAEIIKKEGILTEEEELLKKEEEIKKQEEELVKKELDIKKRKKILGIF